MRVIFNRDNQKMSIFLCTQILFNLKIFDFKISPLRPQGGESEVNFEILRYVVVFNINFQMLLS